MRTRLVFTASAVLLLTLLLAAPAWSASVLALDTRAHLADSTAVVEGVVGGTSQGIDSEYGTPYTDTTVSIDRVLWGTAPKGSLAVRQMKGTVDDRTMFIPGDGDLRPGMRVVLFLMDKGGFYVLNTLGQSVFEVHGSGPTARLHQQLGDLAMFTRDERGAVVPLDEPIPAPATLGALVAEIDAVKEER
ncbi:MAG: hypothetical protein KDA24_23450 [Deltaproteobacteria bacterium]|nr:hypothetical protein [Deltaproteobacteria bacterium]